MEEQVILVDLDGNESGLMGKMEAHQKGVLHKAFSVILFNSKNEMLLQQRAASKYHWPLIWSNACCSHPRAGEHTIEAAGRRLGEELGFETPLDYLFTFKYKAKDDLSGLTEHELDEVFVGKYDGEVPFNPDEVENIRWVDLSTLNKEMREEPEKFSVWFMIIYSEMKERNLLSPYLK